MELFPTLLDFLSNERTRQNQASENQKTLHQFLTSTEQPIQCFELGARCKSIVIVGGTAPTITPKLATGVETVW